MGFSNDNFDTVLIRTIIAIAILFICLLFFMFLGNSLTKNMKHMTYKNIMCHLILLLIDAVILIALAIDTIINLVGDLLMLAT